MAKAVLTFALYQGEALQRKETVAQDVVKVGKDPKSHLRVDDEQASRMHAVIEVSGPEDITLIDLGNEPGTMVNGARVNKCKLHVGDQIQVGGTTIVLESAEAAPAEAAVAQAPAGAARSGASRGTGGSCRRRRSAAARRGRKPVRWLEPVRGLESLCRCGVVQPIRCSFESVRGFGGQPLRRGCRSAGRARRAEGAG